jgi:glycerol-3-phosphate dehydrogenase
VETDYYFSRARSLVQLSEREYDIAIIGGGITGAGIARDAAMRGLSVALVDAKDFSSGTSSRSSKMLHGGIRYLEQFHLGLVFEASQERRLHSEKLCPHLAEPVPYMIPIYPWSPHGRMAVSIGVLLYDALALFRNHGTRFLSRQQSVLEEPNLEVNGLKGSVVFHDVVMDDARITIENLRSAAFHGAVVANYVVVRGFEKNSSGKICGFWAKDDSLDDGADFLVKAKLVVNATGPWSDYIRKLDKPEAQTRLRPTKGVHLILPPERLGKKHAFVLTAKKDDRVFFSVPWFGRTLVGTTDTDYKPEADGDLHAIHATQNEIDYLMEGVKRTFPGADVTQKDILSTFAGVRPLVADPTSANPSAISREHLIWEEASGLLCIAGGKYTTYRTMAQQLVDRAVRILRGNFNSFGTAKLQRCVTGNEVLVLPHSTKEKERYIHLLESFQRELGSDVINHLQLRYGARWQNVAELALDRSELRGKVIAGESEILAEAVYARDFEMAVEFEDYLRRRTQMALRSPLVKNQSGVDKAYKIFRANQSVSFPKQMLEKIQGVL